MIAAIGGMACLYWVPLVLRSLAMGTYGLSYGEGSCFAYHLLMFQYQYAIVTFRPCELSVFVSHIFFLTVVYHLCGWVGMLVFKTLTRITHIDSHRSWAGMLRARNSCAHADCDH